MAKATEITVKVADMPEVKARRATPDDMERAGV